MTSTPCAPHPSRGNAAHGPTPEQRSAEPTAMCDVVMKGGITSGVIYPRALRAIGARYRLRGVGGASAGAIGAALGAAAEHGRASGGFDRLDALPADLSDGRLAALFQPERSTRRLLGLLLTATGNDRPGPAREGVGRFGAVLGCLVRCFPWAGLLGVLPGAALVGYGVVVGGAPGVVLVLAGLVIAVVGWIAGIGARLTRQLTVDVPENLFGICRGLSADGQDPGLTDWLAERIDDLAGIGPRDCPLRFGQLWTGTSECADVSRRKRRVDLRMISTCLSQGRPYEMPWEARHFFYDPEAWATLFPPHVMRALVDAPPAAPPAGDGAAAWQREEELAATHSPALRRLPAPEHLPVIVAVRLSLSFPLLISAVPLWTVSGLRASTGARHRSATAPAPADGATAPASDLEFIKLWFTDGGLCSNFPVHLFDAPLPTRPTFDISLGPFPDGRAPAADERENVELATTNRRGLPPTLLKIPDRGFPAVVGFVSAALNTARNWQDSSHLDFPGFRDRIVRVLQTPREGGINLNMDGPTIARLAGRGRAAGMVIVEQFTEPRYPPGAPRATGWDNHRWVRYRALMSVLPAWLTAYADGRQALDVDPASPPGYPLSMRGIALADSLSDALDAAARVVTTADEDAVGELTEEPRPVGVIRRIPVT
ncbi:patatin-like phospholipase family protein [Georgenia sp. SYP-B2076]|uniref:patatin-like phospholipase family protein n=1 Tax=Georgenia sp. SYP-B2076 TaxID=2495881 RepID=UPI000F8C9C45|nr:patatin-like phospholipase family protein [Georgenia sp. SYP-B2076]